MLDVSTLTLGEIAKVEELSGQSVAMLGEDDTPKGLMMAALVFVIKRREDPTFTWNAACAMTMDEATELLGIEDEEPEDQGPEVDHPDAPVGEALDPTGRHAQTQPPSPI